jgi:hypothetical protein
MADVDLEPRSAHIGYLEQKIRRLLASTPTRDSASRSSTPSEQKIKDDYALWLTEQKKRVTTRRIIKSKECFSKLITKKNMPLFDFSKLSPKKQSLAFRKVVEVQAQAENPFRPSPDKDTSRVSRVSRVTGTFEDGSWQLQSPCFGKKPEVDITVDDSDSDRASSVAFIEKRVFKPVQNVWPRKHERVGRQPQKWGWAK